MKEKTNAANLRGILTFVLFVIAIGASHVAMTQDRFSVQFRPGVSFATTKLGDANLKTGFGFEVEGAYRFMPHVSVYAGWGWNRFSSKCIFCRR